MNNHNYFSEDTIVAISTPSGSGAIGVVRLSGPSTRSILQKLAPGLNATSLESHKAHFAILRDRKGKVLDESVITWFENPKSYTGQDTAEISCHGSQFILSHVIDLCLEYGARLANPGEFTQRAFLAGKLDLSQAEAVADLIASESAAEHRIALDQMRGQFSSDLKKLRAKLVEFTALLELELDFAEEDVEFADRKQFLDLINQIKERLQKLLQSFLYGNVIKKGVPVAIVGKPNAGKSSLLNAVVGDEKAIVSNIAGTTRDTIEDVIIIDGIKFRFIDTAGLRDSEDEIETIGVERAKAKALQARIVLFIFDASDTHFAEIISTIQELYHPEMSLFLIENKIDQNIKPNFMVELLQSFPDNVQVNQSLRTSVLTYPRQDDLKSLLSQEVKGWKSTSSVTVSNSRHKTALQEALTALQRAATGLNSGLSQELVAQDIKEALRHLGSITGEIDVDKDILETIFGSFCIGK